MSVIDRGRVAAFLTALASAERSMIAEFPEFDGLAQVLSLRSSRRGVTGDGIEYAVHGVGCRFVHPDGIEVDVDFLPDGTVVFDAWRLAGFVGDFGSLAGEGRRAVEAVCRELVGEGVLREVKPGWFAEALP